MKRLDLSLNSFADSGARILSECIHNIDDIQLHDCGITEEGVTALSEQIKKRTTPVYNLLLLSNNYQHIKNAEAKFFAFHWLLQSCTATIISLSRLCFAVARL